MTTIEAQVPKPVLEQARILAECEGIPLAQIISLAVTQSVGVWIHESYVAHRAGRASRVASGRASRVAFETALGEVPDAPAMPGDEWPQ